MLPLPLPVLLYVTTPDEAAAEAIARQVVEAGLAACANILPGMRSIYRWQGAIETAQEAVLILKTTESFAGAAQEKIRSLHPYECPCILQLKTDGGHAPYLQWLLQESQGVKI
jgi:periplasmic divalent cation tolerance protein